MNRIGIHYAYWSRDWDTDIPAQIRRAAKIGFNAMDITTAQLMALPKETQVEIRNIAKELDVKLAMVPAVGPELDIAVADEATRRNGIDTFKRNIEFTAEMGSDILAGILYSSWQPKIEGVMNDKSEYEKRSLDSLAEILPVAEKCGVKYCLEVVNRFETYLLNTAAEGVAFVEKLNSPAAMLLLDTFHMNIEEDDMGAAIRLAGDKIGHFHVGECNRKVPGRGDDGRMPWKTIFAALKDVNYQGVITMEPFVKMGGEVGKSIAVWRDLVEGGDDVMDADAAFALNFIKEGMA